MGANPHWRCCCKGAPCGANTCPLCASTARGTPHSWQVEFFGVTNCPGCVLQPSIGGRRFKIFNGGLSGKRFCLTQSTAGVGVIFNCIWGYTESPQRSIVQFANAEDIGSQIPSPSIGCDDARFTSGFDDFSVGIRIDVTGTGDMILQALSNSNNAGFQFSGTRRRLDYTCDGSTIKIYNDQQTCGFANNVAMTASGGYALLKPCCGDDSEDDI